MKKETVKRYGFALVVFLLVLISVSAIFAFILLKTDADKALAFYSACAADLISCIISCEYLVRAGGNPFDALIFSAILGIKPSGFHSTTILRMAEKSKEKAARKMFS